MSKSSNVVSIDNARFVNSDWERWKHNVLVGYALIDAGIPVFVTDQEKHPLILDFNSLDSEFDADTRREIIAEDLEERRRKFVQDNGRDPVIDTDIREKRFVGATLDKKVFKRMMSTFRTLEPVPGVSVWPAGFAVVDIDERKYPGAIEMITQAFDSHGQAVSDFPNNATRSGGKHIYTRHGTAIESNNVRYGGKVWGDVKGKTQVIAPGAVLATGQTYGSAADLQRLCEMYKAGTIPALPQFVADMVGARRSGESNSVSEREVQALKAELRQTELPDAGALLDPALDGFDMPKIEQRYPKFREAIAGGDFSSILFNLAGALKAERADVTAAEYAAILLERNDCGEFVDDEIAVAGVSYNWRSVTRGFLRAVPLSTEKSTGETFGAVGDDESEEDEADVSQEVQDTWESAALKRADRAARLKAEREGADAAARANSGKPPKPPKSEAWYENAAFIPVDLDINKLPPRPYLYNTYLLRGHVTLLSAGGGIGKSAWFLSAAIDMACGVDHLNAGDFRQRKVIVYNAEDDLTEMYRRAGAYMLHHKFTDEMKRHVRENLTLISGVSGPMKLADYRDGRVIISRNSIELLKQMITEREIEVMGLDPLVGLHTIPENANAEMNDLIMAIKGVTQTCDVATLVAHHDKKNIGNRDVGEASQDDARGAGTITTPMRVILSMKRLSKSDIKRLNIPPEDVPNVFSLSKGAKSNYSARDNGSRLFELTSVHATNGNEEHGPDSTLALRPYKLRATGPQISDDERDTILAEIAKGEFRSDPQANGPLIGFVSQLVGVDSGDADWRKQVNGLLVEWLTAGWIVKEKAKVKGHKREVPVYKLGPVTPPPAVVVFEAVEDEDD